MKLHPYSLSVIIFTTIYGISNTNALSRNRTAQNGYQRTTSNRKRHTFPNKDTDWLESSSNDKLCTRRSVMNTNSNNYRERNLSLSSPKSWQKEELSEATIKNRKQALSSISSVLQATTVGIISSSISPQLSHAFDKTFPVELTDIDDNKSLGVVVISQRSNSQQRKQNAEQAKKKMNQNLLNFNLTNDLLPSIAWGLAFFFASGSRNSPIATPLANIIYDQHDQKNIWLRDRNEGLFASPPLPFLFLLSFLFLCIGFFTQFSLLQLSEGDSVICGQLAGVSVIGSGFFEIGRIANGEKRMTRNEKDRAVQLKEDFDKFAENRLRLDGNCHRSDIVKAFRRYHAKYRQDSREYPLTDLEIERLIRFWNQQENQGKAEMSSSGFYYGIQINKDADVFV
mmetsp:Transcript_48692/g.55227  ORF Transcript_48692/g.55227 Transcript_48692/m.55227 type:complete len:397 (+) Transcript_48692:2-1192(+)